MLSAIGLFLANRLRGRRKRQSPNRGAPPEPGGLSSLATLAVLVGAVGYVVRQVAGAWAIRKCASERQDGERRCARYEDRGYAACSRYEDQGYSACQRYEDQGYNSCAEWRRQCCDWWPCSWACELISWLCVAWVWVSNLVCVAWVWVSNLVCVAWTWITSRVCTLWVWVTYPVCIAWCALRHLFTGSEVSQRRTECIYGWTVAYQVTEREDCVLAVVVRIRLEPDAGISQADLQAARDRWEQAVERAWTDRFRIRRTSGDCPCQEYRVVVDVQWVNSGQHHTVRVRAGSGRADMGNWFITSTGGTAAHEVGHMFGNPDEYPDDNCPDRTLTNDGSIMRSSQTGQVRSRHYRGFAEWISARTCCDYRVAE